MSFGIFQCISAAFIVLLPGTETFECVGVVVAGKASFLPQCIFKGIHTCCFSRTLGCRVPNHFVFPAELLVHRGCHLAWHLKHVGQPVADYKDEGDKGQRSMEWGREDGEGSAAIRAMKIVGVQSMHFFVSI